MDIIRDAIRGAIGDPADAGEREEASEMKSSDVETMESQLADISKTVKLLEKFQWISNGIAISVVIMGGWIWNTTNNQIKDITNNFRQEIKTEILVDSINSDVTAIKKSMIDLGTMTASDQARIDQLEKDLIKLNSFKGR